MGNCPRRRLSDVSNVCCYTKYGGLADNFPLDNIPPDNFPLNMFLKNTFPSRLIVCKGEFGTYPGIFRALCLVLKH